MKGNYAMRVLFISAGDYKYGAPKSMFELIVSLKNAYGVEPVLLTKKHNELNDKCDALGIENYSFWSRDIMAGSAYRNPVLNMMKQCVKFCLYLWGGLTVRWQISQMGIDFDSIDIIHTNLNRNDIGCYISKKYNIPHIWHLRELGGRDYKIHAYRRDVTDYMNKNANCFIAISETVCRAWAERGLDAKKIKVIYNGLDVSCFKQRKMHVDDKVKIVMTGRIEPFKGQDQLIEAIGLLPDEMKKRIVVDIYGEAYSDYESYLRKNIKKMELEDIIHFCGYCNNVPEMLADYDIGIVASKAEGFGRVTVEYMLAGLMVIASDTGANTELIDDGRNGLIYSYGDVQDLAEKIKKVIKNLELVNSVGREARKDAEEKYDNARYAREVYCLYEELLGVTVEKGV